MSKREITLRTNRSAMAEEDLNLRESLASEACEMPLGSVADDEHRKTWFRVGFDAARANPKAGAPGAVNITADQLTALAIIVDKAVSHGLPEAAGAKKIITELKSRLSRKMTAARARDAKRVV